MTDSIKGVIAKIGADTSDFIKELKKADKEINQTAKTATELEKSLELDFNEKRFTQAQKKAQQALTQTNEKAEAIRKQLKFLEDSGAVDTDGYRKLETELAKAEVTAIKLNQQLKNLDKIELSNKYKDFYESVKKGSEELTKSAKNATDLSNKIKDTSLYGKELKNVQQQAREQLSNTRKEAEQLRNKLKQAYEEKIPIEDYKELTKQLEDAEKSANELEKELEKSSKINVSRLANQFSNLSDKLNSAASATRGLSVAAVGAIAGTYKLAKETAAAGAELQDYSDRLNISAESLQRWEYVAMQSGVETDQLTKAMAKSRDAIGTAMSGTTNTATKALQALFGDLSKIPQGTEEGFDAIVQALGNVKDSTMQAYYANEIFGERIATNLVPLFNNSSERLAQLNGEFEQIGYLTNEQVQALADFDDQMNIFNGQLKMAGAELGTALIPVLQELLQIFKDVALPIIKDIANWLNTANEGTKKMIIIVTLLTAALSPVLSILSKIIKVVPAVIKLFKSLNAATLKTTAGFAALGGALGFAIDLIGNWKQMSTVEKILKSLAVAALVAAAAMTVFHASWSAGLAIGAITAGVVAGIAAIKAAGEEIGVETDFDDTQSLTQVAQSSNIPQANGGSKNIYNEDYSQYDININMSATGDLSYDSKALADEVIKQIILKKQAAGN